MRDAEHSARHQGPIGADGCSWGRKTTLAVTVQAMLEEPYWHLSLDDFLHGYTAQH